MTPLDLTFLSGGSEGGGGGLGGIKSQWQFFLQGFAPACINGSDLCCGGRVASPLSGITRNEDSRRTRAWLDPVPRYPAPSPRRHSLHTPTLATLDRPYLRETAPVRFPLGQGGVAIATWTYRWPGTEFHLSSDGRPPWDSIVRKRPWMTSGTAGTLFLNSCWLARGGRDQTHTRPAYEDTERVSSPVSLLGGRCDRRRGQSDDLSPSRA